MRLPLAEGKADKEVECRSYSNTAIDQMVIITAMTLALRFPDRRRHAARRIEDLPGERDHR